MARWTREQDHGRRERRPGPAASAESGSRLQRAGSLRRRSSCWAPRAIRAGSIPAERKLTTPARAWKVTRSTVAAAWSTPAHEELLAPASVLSMTRAPLRSASSTEAGSVTPMPTTRAAAPCGKGRSRRHPDAERRELLACRRDRLVADGLLRVTLTPGAPMADARRRSEKNLAIFLSSTSEALCPITPSERRGTAPGRRCCPTATTTTHRARGEVDGLLGHLRVARPPKLEVDDVSAVLDRPADAVLWRRRRWCPEAASR